MSGRLVLRLGSIGLPMVVSASAICSLLLPAANAAAAASAKPPITHVRTYSVPRSNTMLAVDDKRGLVYVAAQDGGTRVAVLNEHTGKLSSVHVANGANRIAVSTKTGFAYIPNYNAGKVIVLAGTHRKGSVTVGGNPSDVVVDQNTGLAYVDTTGTDGKTITVLAGATIVQTIALNGLPGGGEAINSKTHTLYVSDYADKALMVVRGGTQTATIPVGGHPLTPVIDATRDLVYVQNDDNGKVSVIHGDTLQTTLSLLGGPTTPGINGRTGLTYFVTSEQVTLVRDGGVIKTIPLACEPLAVAVDAANGIATITCTGGPMYVFRNRTKLHTVTLPDGGDQARFDPKTGREFVAIYSRQPAHPGFLLDVLQTRRG